MPTNFNSQMDVKAVITYRRIRNAIGLIGISLPVFLLAFSLIPFFETPIQISISHYYYTNLRELFTGSLCAVGLFLIRYEGYGAGNIFWKNDSLLTNIAGVMAFGIALFPTDPIKCIPNTFTLIPVYNGPMGLLHYGFAAIFFLTFSLISYNVFTIGQNIDKDISISILNENNIYRFSGFFIFLCIVFVPILSHFDIYNYSTTLLESIALFSFGLSWLIKGRAFGDKGLIGRKVYREYRRKIKGN